MNSSGSPDARSENLKGRVLFGLIWTNLGQVLQIVLQLVALVVLARLLSPHDFGVFTIALIIIGVTESVFWPCLEQAIVQHKGKVDEFVCVAWTGNLFCVLAGCLIAIPLVPLLTEYVFAVPEATLVTWLMLVCPLCTALKSPRMMLAQRNIDLKAVFYVTSAFTVFRYLGAIAVAFWFQSYWALAIAFVAGRVAEVAISYILLWYRPRIVFNAQRFTQLYDFSSWLQAGSVLKIFSRYLDSIVIGSVMSSTMLGLYNRAWTISAIPLQGLEVIIYRVFFPMFSAVQGKARETERQVKRATDYSLLMWSPIFVALAVAGEQIVDLLLGAQWLVVAAILPTLVAGLAIRSLVLIFYSVLRANSFSRDAFLLNVIPVAIVAVSVVPLVQNFGLVGAAMSIVLSGLVSLACVHWVIRKRLQLSVRTWLLSILACFLASAATLLVMFWLIEHVALLGDYMVLRVGIACILLLLILAAIQSFLKIGPVDTLLATFQQLLRSIKESNGGKAV